MSKKGSNFFEKHIEKAVLGLVGVVCLWVLVTRVIMSPNFVVYDNAKFSAGRIDDYIGRQSDVLENKMNQAPQAATAYKSHKGDFVAKFSSALSDIDANAYPPQPGSTSRDVSYRLYAAPQVGKINGADAEHIRGVALVPKHMVNEEHTYQTVESEPNDVDIVTVEAKFDVAGLNDRFYSNFAGENVRNEQWRDPCLAIPVFAAVQLQRQEQMPDGSWSEWQVVPRTKIDSHRKMFEVEQDVRKLPAGGVRVRLLQFNDPILRKGLLQPESYKFISGTEEWLPPSFHKELLKIQQALRDKEKEAKRIKSREEAGAASPHTTRPTQAATTRPTKGTDTRAHGGKQLGEDSGSTGLDTTKHLVANKPRPNPPAEKERPDKSKEVVKTVADVHNKFSTMQLGPATDLTRMNIPLYFWAVDDTVKPDSTYRYRIRLGVFDPIAGTSQFREEDKRLKNDVILWSDFSDVTKDVEIPARLYFFPKEFQEGPGTVMVQVSKFMFGNWYSKDFAVKRGETIGKTARTEVTGENTGVLIPETINYDTGAILVDVVPTNDWSENKGLLHSRNYFDMLYSFDGKELEHMPIKNKNWDDSMQAKFLEIKKAEKEPKVALHDWSPPADMTGFIQQKNAVQTHGD